jgi:hypothetical protein
MERTRSNRLPDASSGKSGPARAEKRVTDNSSYRATNQRLFRWLTDEQDELDGIVVRTWN